MSHLAAIVAAKPPAPSMDVMAVSGFLIGFLTLVYWLHRRSHRHAGLGFSICLMSMAVHSFMVGAWQVGVLLIAWSAVAFNEWRGLRKIGIVKGRPNRRVDVGRPWNAESRIHRIFGQESSN